MKQHPFDQLKNLVLIFDSIADLCLHQYISVIK